MTSPQTRTEITKSGLTTVYTLNAHGSRHGPALVFNLEGLQTERQEWVDDVQHGITYVYVVPYPRDESCPLARIELYEYGQLVQQHAGGFSVKHPAQRGSLSEKLEATHETKILVDLDERGRKCGIERQYGSDGSLWTEISWVDDKQHGLTMNYMLGCKTRRLKSVRYYCEGRGIVHDDVEGPRADARLIALRNRKEDEKVLTLFTLDSSFRKNGPCYSFLKENKALHSTSTYVADLKSGLELYYEGKKMSLVNLYENGKLIESFSGGFRGEIPSITSNRYNPAHFSTKVASIKGTEDDKSIFLDSVYSTLNGYKIGCERVTHRATTASPATVAALRMWLDGKLHGLTIDFAAGEIFRVRHFVRGVCVEDVFA